MAFTQEELLEKVANLNEKITTKEKAIARYQASIFDLDEEFTEMEGITLKYSNWRPSQTEMLPPAELTKAEIRIQLIPGEIESLEEKIQKASDKIEEYQEEKTPLELLLEGMEDEEDDGNTPSPVLTSFTATRDISSRFIQKEADVLEDLADDVADAGADAGADTGKGSHLQPTEIADSFLKKNWKLLATAGALIAVITLIILIRKSK